MKAETELKERAEEWGLDAKAELMEVTSSVCWFLC
jgi:hypothetical protein